MNPYFTKINLDLTDCVNTAVKLESYTETAQYFKLFTITDACRDQVMAKFPIEMQPYITRITYGAADHDLLPHRDIASCMLNYYVEPAGGMTTFYNTRPYTKEKVWSHGARSYISYDVNELDKVEEFTAEKNSCYLLNVAEVHAVDNIKKTPRQILQFRFQVAMSYYQAYNILNLHKFVV